MNFENYEDLYFSRKLLSFLVKELREDPITTIQQLERWNDRLVEIRENDQLMEVVKTVDDFLGYCQDPDDRAAATLFRAMMVDRLLRQNPAIWEAFNNWISGELMDSPSKN